MGADIDDVGVGSVAPFHITGAVMQGVGVGVGVGVGSGARQHRISADIRVEDALIGWSVGADGGGAVCRRGVRRGAVSRPFRARDLLQALAKPRHTVYVDVDSAGYLVTAAAGSEAGGGAVLCASATLASNVSARNAVLTVLTPSDPEWSFSTTPDTLLQLRLESSCAPHSGLRVWPDERLRILLQLPHLTLHNIRGEKEYACHQCESTFLEPNPLKVHMYLACAAPEPRRFLRAVAVTVAQRLLPSPSPSPSPSLLCDPARLETLATSWGGGAHACVYCGKLYSRKYGLKIHIRTHTGYRPLRCRHCARAFGDPSNLNKHLRLHETPSSRARATGGSALRCPRCDKALARRRDLQRHLRTHGAATCTVASARTAPPTRTPPETPLR